MKCNKMIIANGANAFPNVPRPRYNFWARKFDLIMPSLTLCNKREIGRKSQGTPDFIGGLISGTEMVFSLAQLSFDN